MPTLRPSLVKDFTNPYSSLESFIYDAIVAPAVTELGAPIERELGDVARAARVLDVGCGGGHNALLVAMRRPDLDVTGLDLSEDQVRRARARANRAGVAARVRFVPGNAQDMPFDDESYDVVMSIASIKHWPDPARGLSECARVLKPGGRLLVVEADRSCRIEDATAFVDRWRFVGGPLRAVALAAFRTWVAGQSFDVEEARALIGALPLDERSAERIPGTPGLLMRARRP